MGKLPERGFLQPNHSSHVHRMALPLAAVLLLGLAPSAGADETAQSLPIAGASAVTAVSACAPSDLTTRPGSGGVGMGGFAVLSILLVNTGSTTCTLSGNATVSVVTPTGTASLVSTPVSGTTNFGTYAVTTIAIAPGGAAQLFVGFDGGACPAASSVQILVPGSSSTLSFSKLPSPGICGSRLEVSPFVPSSAQVFSSYPPSPVPTPAVSSAPACPIGALSAGKGSSSATVARRTLRSS